ncbi:MAG: hypothetical protein P4L36_10600 [Holophaga sp.]|nr:hypothetical protein [Holophaga sp.]
MQNEIITCHSFPELVEELQAAKQRGSRLLTAAPDAQFGQAVGFKLSDGNTYRLTLAKVKQFEQEQGSYPQMVELWNLISTTDGRIKMFMIC